MEVTGLDYSYRARSLAAEFSLLTLLSTHRFTPFKSLQKGLFRCESGSTDFDFCHWAQADLPDVLFRLAASSVIEIEGGGDIELESFDWRHKAFRITSDGARYRDQAEKAAGDLVLLLRSVLECSRKHWPPPFVKAKCPPTEARGGRSSEWHLAEHAVPKPGKLLLGFVELDLQARDRLRHFLHFSGQLI